MPNNIDKMWETMGIDPTTGTGTYKNRMGLSNTITRDYSLPLDLSSVHSTYEDAVVYAATNPIAYVDQIVAAKGIAYIITEESQGTIKISSYRDSITGKLVKGVNKEFNIYLKPLTGSGEANVNIVEGDGIEIVEQAGQKVISLQKNGITDEHINSVSVSKLFKEEETLLVLNGGNANG